METETPITDSVVKTTDWISGQPVVEAENMRKLELKYYQVRDSLRILVDCGGIGPEQMFDDARELLK